MPLVGGVATLNYSGLPVGSRTIVATYNGDGNFVTSSNSPAFSQTVNKANTSTTITATASPSTYGSSATFTATVTTNSPGTLLPTAGELVTFLDGSTPLGMGALNASGVATFTTNTLIAGSHIVIAKYVGDSSFNVSQGSLSPAFVVNSANSSTAVTASLTSTSIGEPVTFTATVTGNLLTPTGTVTFFDGTAGTNPIGTATLDGSGVATVTTSALTGGTHTITAVYAGDAGFKTSTGSLNNFTVTGASSSTAVVASPAATVFGQSATFTATVSPVFPATGVPTGTVTFIVDGTPISGPSGTVALSGGKASLALNTLTASATAHTIDARYNGDNNFGTSTSVGTGGTASELVSKASTGTAVQSSGGGNSVFGQGVNFTATVTSTLPGTGTPTGNVTFEDTSTPTPTILQANVTLVNGVASLTNVNSFSVGGHSIVAIYNGDTNYTTSINATAFGQTVTAANTTTHVTAAPSTSGLGQSVTFSATITVNAPGSGSIPTTESVAFFDSNTQMGTGTINAAGVATFSTSSLTLGQHSISAKYAGDTNFNTSTGALTSQYVVTSAGATTTLTSSANPTYGQSITFTATVTGGFGTPTGVVSFFDGSTQLGSFVNLNGSGVATVSTSGLAGGVHNITAVYGGNNTYTGSTGQLNPFTVNRATPTVGITGSPASGSTVVSQSVTFTATVGPTGSGVMPTGTVSFYDGVPAGNNQIGTTVNLVNGSASVTTNSLAGGSHTVTVVYNADTNYASNSNTLSYVVNPAGTATSLTVSPASSLVGQSVTFTATVAVLAPASVTPTGTVNFMDNSTSPATFLGSAPVNASGVATFPTTALGVGIHNVVAVFVANSSFATSTSAAATETVAAAQSSTTTITPTSTVAVFGQALTFTASVTGSFGTATGQVRFIIDGTPQTTTVPLSNGQATLSLSTLGVTGATPHTISVTYGGDGPYGPSSPATAANVTVNPDNTVTTVTSSSVNNTSVVGQSVTFTATVNAAAPGSGTPTGQVQFSVGGTLTTVNLVGGKATLTTSSLPLGMTAVTATYLNGDSNFNASPTSTTLFQNVLTTASKLSATLSPTTVSVGTAFTITTTALSSTNQVVTQFNGPATISLVSFPTGGTITGTLTGSFVNGVAKFTGLKVTLKGSYVVRISAPGTSLSTTVTIASL